MSYPYDPDENEDLANPRPWMPLVLVAVAVGLLVLGVVLAVFLLLR